MAAKNVANPVQKLQKWYYYRCYFPQLGLKSDDVNYDEGQTDVKEALRRLPRKTFYEREFRISRAVQLSLQKELLPKSEWTVYEEDKPYLKEIIEDVRDEMDEKVWWKKYC
ncbi:cytochrome b-c1 complex subunit 7-like [Watersipora subatra]|uniref:cytochrome b-c1 complex subunit 7-like n=1 Tax=Watersipora subatra TaxID=2589382 RepID=UPI00355BC490